MKKILQAFDGAATKKSVQGANDMKKFLSIVVESTSPYKPVEEAVISSFEEGSLGGDANSFLLAADNINDLVMSNIDKIKINANEEKLKDMMAKFNSFMSAYHAVGKEILQPDMFDDVMGESALKDKEDYDAKSKTLQDLSMTKGVDQSAVQQRKLDLEKEARAKGFKEELDSSVEEAKDTVVKDKDGKVVSWSHEGDWKKAEKKDPVGKVHNLSDKARRETEKMATKEGLSFKDYINLAEAKSTLVKRSK